MKPFNKLHHLYEAIKKIILQTCIACDKNNKPRHAAVNHDNSIHHFMYTN